MCVALMHMYGSEYVCLLCARCADFCALSLAKCGCLVVLRLVVVTIVGVVAIV